MTRAAGAILAVTAVAACGAGTGTADDRAGAHGDLVPSGDVVPADPGTNVTPTDALAADAPAETASADPGTGVAPFAFVPFPWLAAYPDAATDRLCDEEADPAEAPDTTYLHCRAEGGDFTTAAAAPRDRLVVLAYNLERGVHLDEQIARLTDGNSAPVADLMLLSEVDRGCPRSGTRNVAKDLGEALGMHVVFATEFVELVPDPDDPAKWRAQCEHGDALLSRYPVGNVRPLRFAAQRSWYAPPGSTQDQPRLGGRLALIADVQVGDRYLHVAALHLESAGDDAIRTAQAAEIAEEGLSQPWPVVVGGDLNAGFYFVDVNQGEPTDPTVMALTDRGYVDAHEGLPPEARPTFPQMEFVLDLVLGVGVDFGDPAVGDGSAWDGLSDHRPIWVTAAPRWDVHSR